MTKNFYGVLCVNKVDDSIISIGVLYDSLTEAERERDLLNSQITEAEQMVYKVKKFVALVRA